MRPLEKTKTSRLNSLNLWNSPSRSQSEDQRGRGRPERRGEKGELGEEGVFSGSQGMETKAEKAACFKIGIFQNGCHLSPGIFRESHRTRAAASLTSVQQGRLQICSETSSSASPPPPSPCFSCSGTRRPDLLPTLHSSPFPPFPPVLSSLLQGPEK